MESIRWAFNFRAWSPMKDEWMLCLSLIQQEEKDRISKFVFKRDAKASLAGRLLMRKVVSEKLNIPWSSFVLQRTEKGRPFYPLVCNDRKQKFDFNVSHQGQWVVLAAESNVAQVGVDVMEIEKARNKNVPEFFRLMRKQFTSEEWCVIKKNASENSQLMAFYRNWCLKEAFVKCLGVGISYNLQSISFTPFSDLTSEAIIGDTRVKVSGIPDPSWNFEESLIGENHIATVALHHCDKEYTRTQFKIFSFEDLILKSEKILPLDCQMADEFMCKQESPNYYADK